MRLVKYTPDRFEALASAALRFAQRTRLDDRQFVEFYYSSNERCELHLALNEADEVIATLGLELMPFETEAGPMIIGAGSNFHSLSPGVGGLLFHLWMSSCDAGLVYGGSDDTHRILRGRKWSYFPGVHAWWLNRPIEARPGEPWHRRAAKAAVTSLRRIVASPLSARAGLIPPELRKRYSVRQEGSFSRDMLPTGSPFAFRFAPELEHLAWRYPPGLALADYRLFRVLDRDRTAGYVVLRAHEGGLSVAQADADSLEAIGGGVLASLVEPPQGGEEPARWAVLNTCHGELAELYRSFGFVPEARERPFALGTARGPVSLGTDTSTWLVNRDWADIGFIASGPNVA